MTGLAPAPTGIARPARPPDGRPVAGAVLVLTVLVSALLIAFAWPAARSAPRDVPLGVAGPAAAAAQVERQLAAARPGAFELHAYADEAAARTAIAEREVYGAVVLGSGGPAVLTASAASPAVAQALTQLAQGLGADAGAPVRVDDVVPTPADDPRGAGLAAAVLPLLLGGVATAVALTLLGTALGWQVAGAVASAVVGGLAVTAILKFWIGALDGSSYLVLSGVLALGIAAVSLSLLGLGSVLGRAGLALGAAGMIALGNPLSGAASAPEMLPAGWGALGQLLPPGAAVTLLRSTAFFDGHGGGGALAVLLGWVAAGLLLAAAGAARAASRRAAAPS